MPIPQTTKPHRLAENLAAVDLDLTADELVRRAGCPGRAPLTRVFLTAIVLPTVDLMTSTRFAHRPDPLRPGRWPLPLVLALYTAAACSAVPNTSSPTTGSPEVSSTQPSAAPSSSAPSASGTGDAASASPSFQPSPSTTPISVTVGGQTFAAELYDNPTAHDLVDQLPLTLAMDDHNRVEKTGRLPRGLTTEDAPRGSDPEPDEIGYYAPGQDLVLYYGDMGYYTGIIRIGRFDGPVGVIGEQPGRVTVTVRRA